MRRSTLVGGLAAALASMVLVLPPPAAVSAQTTPGSIFSDLFLILRTEDGLPIPATFYEGTPEEVECVQPISYTEIPAISSVVNPVDGQDVWLVPLLGEAAPATLSLEPADDDVPGPCDIQPAYADYASEADLERLNLARAPGDFIDRKLAEVEARLSAATEITLDGAGRIATDGVSLDASPEYAAMYQALMDTGTIPGLGVSPAEINQGSGGFDWWMLAAAAIGTAGGKTVPIGPDTIEYYGRIASDGAVQDWGYVPVLTDTFGDPPEYFIDYTDFSYTRSDVYQGCSIWLDVPTLTWKSGRILDQVEFLDVVPTPGTVDNVAGFTQLADDVRSVINYLHQNEVVVDPVTGYGFYIDPVFQDTCNDPNPDLDPYDDGVGLSQAAMAAYLNDLVIEAEPPTVTITDAPAATTTATDATFEFDASTDASRVLCILDGGAIQDCTSPKTYTDLEVGPHTFTVMAMSVEGKFASDTHTWEIIYVPEIVSLTPARLADTRVPFVASDGQFTATGPVTSGRTIEVQVAGRYGIPADAEAAVVNLTIARATTNGYATAFPCGTQPPTSSINYQPGENIANELVAKLSPTGTICVYVHRTADVILDAAGYVPAESDYTPLTPVRLADTRAGFVSADGLFTGTGAVPSEGTLEVQIAGRAGIPADAEAVVVNLTATRAATNGYATAFPCGTQPPTSSVNYQTFDSIANELVAKLSPTGTICVYVHRTAQVILDVAGYMPAGSDYTPLTPARLADTRVGFVAADSRFTGTGPVPSGGTIEISIAGRGGIPVDAEAAVLNLTAARALTNGYATVYPCGTKPPTSSVNYQPFDAIANELVAKLSPSGTICVYVHRTSHVIVDTVGYL